MIKSNEHFVDIKKQHTEIKHKLFYDTFNAILGISAKFSEKNSFTYLDLYAGQGKFSDETLGSPMLALKTILESDVIDSFHQVKCFFSEADSSSYRKLEENIKDLLYLNNSHSNIITSVKSGAWSENTDDIDELLKYSKWGFVFADPFSNEINMDELLTLLENRTKFKDFMLFINLQAIKRIVGRYPKNESVANFLGVLPNELTSIVRDNNSITKCLRDRFSIMNKDYIINASIPTSKQEALVDIDNFQLLLGTNSIGVSDAFLTSYVEALKEHKSNFACSIFDNISDDILEIVRLNKQISLHKIIQELYTNYNSWKYAEMNNIPISKNIHFAVNELIKQKLIKVVNSPKEFVNKDNTISKRAFNRNFYLKDIILKK